MPRSPRQVRKDVQEAVTEQVRDLPINAVRLAMFGVGRALLLSDRLTKDYKQIKKSGVGPVVERWLDDAEQVAAKVVGRVLERVTGAEEPEPEPETPVARPPRKVNNSLAAEPEITIGKPASASNGVTKVAPKPEPKPAATKPEPVAAPRPEPKPAAEVTSEPSPAAKKPEPKPEPAAPTKAEPKAAAAEPDMAAAITSEPKPAAQKPAPAPAPKPEPKAATAKPEPAAPKPAAKPAAKKPEPKPEPVVASKPVSKPAPKATAKPAAKKPEPEPVAADALPLPNYGELTLASVRARLRTLNIEQVSLLRDYEQANGARAGFIRMYENRIAKLNETS